MVEPFRDAARPERTGSRSWGLCRWRDHDLAVGLDAVPLEVFLVVLLGGIERLERRQLRDDRLAPDLLRRDLPDHLLGGRLLPVAFDCRVHA